MNRRSFLASAAASVQAAPARRPNVLVVLMDDFGIGHFAPHAETLDTKSFDPAFVDFLKRHNAQYTPDEALAMSRRAMPVISSLAKQGVVFTRAFSSSNLCAPSRAGLFTGCSPNRFGIYNNIDFQAQGLPYGSYLVEHLQKAGYGTAMIGKYHTGTRDEALRKPVLEKHGVAAPGALAKLSPEKRKQVEAEILATGYEGSVIKEHHPLRYGFDYYFGYNHHQCPFYDSEQIWEDWTFTGKQPRYNTELFFDKALAFAKKTRAAGKPFFIEVACHAVHGPLKPQAPAKYFDPFASKSFDLQNFYGHVNAVDAAIGAFRDAIGEDEWNNTLFVFTGDNGAPVGMATPLPGNAPHRGHKGGYLLGGIRVPLMAHWPAGIKTTTRRSDALVSTMDIMPSALEAAGIKAPTGIDGRSLIGLANGKVKRIHDDLVMAGIHARAWGFTAETTMNTANPQGRREESPGAWVITDGAYLLRYTGAVIPGLFQDLADGQAAHFELYDLREDPSESRDLARDLPQVVERLRKRYAAQTRNLPPPPVWRKDRWRELMQGAGNAAAN
jgi:uncharacterized sulfatase